MIAFPPFEEFALAIARDAVELAAAPSLPTSEREVTVGDHADETVVFAHKQDTRVLLAHQAGGLLHRVVRRGGADLALHDLGDAPVTATFAAPRLLAPLMGFRGALLQLVGDRAEPLIGGAGCVVRKGGQAGQNTKKGGWFHGQFHCLHGSRARGARTSKILW